jgi:preprotein translocase subunit SecY
MFATFKQLFNPKNKDIRKRILFTFAALFVFKIGTTITVPGVNLDTKNLQLLEIINAMSGGAFENASIFALGVMPYITASIIIQLLSMDIIPYLTELTKQGGVGRQKIQQITRVLGIILAFVQGYMYSFTYIKNGTITDYLLYSLVLTAGTALVMWIGDQITKKGIGNGTSMIIMAGIITTLPGMFVNLWNELITNGNGFLGILTFALFVVVFLAIIIGVIFEECAERRIPIQYANKSTSMMGSQNYIPFKLNSANVIPVIFASALMSIPAIIAQFVQNANFSLFVSKYLSYSSSVIGFIIYFLLIIGFAYLYTFMQLKPKELAENLNKNGGYIPGIRPGDDTENYIKMVLKRITIVGAVFLAVLAALPILFSTFSTLNTSISISGTGLLIVVGVALETYKQLESQLVSRTYTKGRKGRRR